MKQNIYSISTLLFAGLLIAGSANAQWTHSGSKTTLNNKGDSVGIGTTAPAFKLDIQGTAATSVRLKSPTDNATIIIDRGASNTNATLAFRTSGTSNWQIGCAGNNNFTLKNNALAGAVAFYCNAGDNKVGIGTTTPGATLTVANTSLAAINGAGAFQVGQSNAGNLVMDNNEIQARNNGAAAKLFLSYWGGATDIAGYGEELVEIADNGNVGIGGTASTSYKCLVKGLDASGSVPFRSQVEYIGAIDVHAIEGYSHPQDGWGYGVYGEGGYIGLYGVSNNGAYGYGYGVFGTSSGTTGTQIGVYGSSSGGTDNWGGYFPTKTYTSELRVGGSTGASGYVAVINGKLIATEVRVQLQPFPDYVFASGYNLPSISDLENSIKTNNRLPGMPSACDIEQNGLMLGEMQGKVVEKVEEQALYIIQLQKQIDELRMEIKSMKK